MSRDRVAVACIPRTILNLLPVLHELHNETTLRSNNKLTTIIQASMPCSSLETETHYYLESATPLQRISRGMRTEDLQ